MAGKIKFDIGPLKQLKENVQLLEHAHVKVGVLGNKVARKDGGLNNPTIGAVHEFGSLDKKIPARSWLRMPIMSKLPDVVKKIGRSTFNAIAAKNGIVTALETLGTEAYNVIQDAFNTGGFGTWAPLKPSTIRRKKSSAILIDTAQLRQSVSYAVEVRK